MRNYLNFCACVILACVTMLTEVYAQISPVQALDFGEFLVRNNDSMHEITVNTNGTYSFDAAGFVEIVAPQEGIYDFAGFTPNDPITSIVVTQNTPLGVAGNVFNMINFQVSHPPITDGAGVVRITVGATAQANGSGTPYTDFTYEGDLDITVNF